MASGRRLRGPGTLAAAIGVGLLVAGASVGTPAAGTPAPAGAGLGTAGVPSPTGADRRTAVGLSPAGIGLPAAGTDLPSDGVLVRISVRPDGTAVWHVEYRYRLADENATAAFDRLRSRIEARPLAYTGPFAENMSRAAALAEERTGRGMALHNVTVNATRRSVPGPFGIVTYRFEWTAFAAEAGDGRLRVGDALRGLFLTGTDEALQVSWPDRYRAIEVDPEPTREDGRTAVWRGRWDFAPGRPLVVIAPTGPSPTGGGLPVTILLLAATGVLTLVLAAGWLRRRGTDTADDERIPAGSPPDDAPADETPAELLTDGERVVRLLEANGGRMKQQAVVEELGWSETKTSDVVKELHDAGTIDRFRLGRENVLALPGEIDV